MSALSAVPGDRLLYKPEDAADVLSIGRSTLYELMAEGIVKYIKVGRIRRIRRRDLEEFVNSLTPASD
ncbi:MULTISPECIES: helix-turn-helix domain-containing protein [Streptomyces]|uniref:Helix-turn-helix domain-containing protein n=1 Tax=Streptomyces tsukubensis (strain DSM 42081 / NBRC 108919 / NRRL 18488 / 9993) TaxID=1114943 RepID=A0A7G3UHN4_STRT9|nr:MULTISPECIES: helix-turn-helix domain-containing protein [Streptomyces]AZK94846.1 helix-turn-helix domain-containing protein [Streptomyces tsukubensis]MYS66984.1 helix-turn-helix domain-containing protein [Streptomyces sp. SID5473]QKM69071.1 helix-turn-helix domain-containing protein [Streptomyces tsukubensis NRRL18488]TAI40706.1 DNA-binding protein [Streptomyces tsukubensis]